MGPDKNKAWLKQFADETTVHGFSHVANSKSKCGTIFWISALVAVFCWGSCTITKAIYDFIKAPPVKATGVESLQLSNLTMQVCPKHILNVSRIMEERPNLMALSFAFLGLNQFYAREGPAIIIDDWHPMGIFRLHYHLWSTALKCVPTEAQVNDLENTYSRLNDLVDATGLVHKKEFKALKAFKALKSKLKKVASDQLFEMIIKPTVAMDVNESICELNETMAAGIISTLRVQLQELMNSIGVETIDDLLLSYSISYPSLEEVCESSCKINSSHSIGKRIWHDGRICFEYIIPSDAVVGKSLHLKAFLPPDVNYLMEFWKASDAAFSDAAYRKLASGVKVPLAVYDKYEYFSSIATEQEQVSTPDGNELTFYGKYYFPQRRFLTEEVILNMQASPADELTRLNELIWNQIFDHIVENETTALQLLNAEGLRRWAKSQNPNSQPVNMVGFSQLQITFDRLDVKEKGDQIVLDLESKSEFQFEFQRLKILHDADNQCLRKPSTTEPTDVCQYKCFNQRYEDCVARFEDQSNALPKLCSLDRGSNADSSCQSLDYGFLWPDASMYRCAADTWNECLPRETGRKLGIQACFEACEMHTLTVRKYQWRQGGIGKRWDVGLDFRATEFTFFMEESESRNWAALAGNVGGLLGLICGASLISILHLCITISCGCCNKPEE